MWLLEYFIFVGCILSALSDNVVQNVLEESEIDSSLLESIVVYGIISELASRNTKNVSPMCASELTNIVRGINKKDMWALKVMDASGTYQSSFVWGQNAWLGSKEQCDFLNTPPVYRISPDIPKLMDKNLISTLAPMEMNYKMIFLIITSPYKVDPISYSSTANTHRLGLCLPKSCSNEDVELLSKRFFAQRKLNFQKLYSATMYVINVRDMDVKNFLNRPEVIRILFTIGFITALVIVFSFVYKYVEHKNINGLKRFFKCFSIHDNVVTLYDTTSSPNAINCIDGIRSIMCLWVLLLHCSNYAMYAYDNIPILVAAMERIEAQLVYSLLFHIDIFFVLSALLLVLNFLKDEQTLSEVKNSNCIQYITLFVKRIIHRYIRLTPAFLFAIGISHVIAVYIQESSSLYIDETFDAYCTMKGWWSSVFYIHNLFQWGDLCISWSWYIACDMQFYIVILFILFIYAKSPTFAKVLFMALFASITAIGIYSNIKINVLPRLDSLAYHWSEFYMKPVDRMHPYLAGATAGYVMYLLKDKKFNKNNCVTNLYWIVVIPIISASVLLTALKESSNLSLALFFSFGRYIFGIFIGSIVFMCHIGYGGIINKLLSHKYCIHFNKITYTLYLVHPALILYFISNQESSPHFEMSNLPITFLGIFFLSYAAAIVTSTIFEMPFQKLSDEYVMKKSKTKRQSTDPGIANK